MLKCILTVYVKGECICPYTAIQPRGLSAAAQTQTGSEK